MWHGKPNCICSELEWLHTYGGHIERLKKIKSSMNTTGPIKANYSMHTAGIKAMKKQRNDEIYTQNMKLLNRIISINNGGFIPSKSVTVSKHFRSSSLNKPFRKKTELRIMGENQILLSRLRNVRSVYSSKTWQKDHQKHLSLSQSISQSKSIF